MGRNVKSRMRWWWWVSRFSSKMMPRRRWWWVCWWWGGNKSYPYPFEISQFRQLRLLVRLRLSISNFLPVTLYSKSLTYLYIIFSYTHYPNIFFSIFQCHVFFNTIFVSSLMFSANPEGTRLIVSSMNIWDMIYIISETTRTRIIAACSVTRARRLATVSDSIWTKYPFSRYFLTNNLKFSCSFSCKYTIIYIVERYKSPLLRTFGVDSA